jgi:tetratricopeptide (TPR) repeat protein
MSAEELARIQAGKSYVEGHPEKVLELWRERKWEPVGAVELAVVSQALAQAGDGSAEPYIARLESTRPVEAGILLGQLRWRQGRFDEAAGLLEKAFTRYREDPWAFLPVVNQSFTVAADIAGRDRRLAERLNAALAQPFAVLLLNEERLQTRYKVATYLDPSKLEEAIAALEPHVPWRKGFLSRRARLYEATRNPRYAIAQSELDSFLKHESEAPPSAGSPAAEKPASEP